MRVFSIDEPSISVRRNEQFCLVAPAVPTAGYRWLVETKEPGLTVVESSVEPRNDAVGGAASQRIVLCSVGDTSAKIRLVYRQAGGGPVADEREIEISIEE